MVEVAPQPLADLALQTNPDELTKPTLEQTAQTIAANLQAFVRPGDNLTFPLINHPFSHPLAALLQENLGADGSFTVFPMAHPGSAGCFAEDGSIIGVRFTS